MNLNRKKIIINAAIIGFLEVLLFIAFGNNAGIFTTILGVVSIPAVVLLVNIMLISLENTILIFTFLVPMIPISGYLMNRMNLLDYQWIVYTVFYIGTLVIMLKHDVFKKMNNRNLIVKNKYIKIALSILLVVNIIFAYNKQLSFMIISLSFLPFSIYFYIIGTLDIQNKSKLYEKILIAFTLGCIISSMPDILQFILTWINGNKSIRLFGPLGSNFMLSYLLLLFVLIVNKWARCNGIKNYWTILVLILAFIISMQMSRGALFAFIAIFITYLIFNISNWKKYLSVFLVFGCILSFNVFSRADVINDNNIKEIQDIIDSDIAIDKQNSLGESKFARILTKIIETQSKTRQVLWKTGILLTNDYKLTGVGIGNYKSFFNEYSGTTKGYSDSHNIILNLSSELGIPFMILAMLLIIVSCIGALINYFKSKDKDMKLRYISICILGGVILLYGNLTGMNFHNTNGIYSFTPTFMLLFVLFYRDNLLEF